VPTATKPVSSVRDVSVDYLRTTLTLMVVAHHSTLAYTTFARFDTGNYLASTHPVVDSSRWVFLDYAQHFNDIFFMSLMFFVSGLFVWPSLQRHGVGGFLRERFLRLGLPFAFFVTTLMPLAYYASWQLTGKDAGFLDYVSNKFFSHGWPPGPLWFIWVLLMFDGIAALLFAARFNLQKFDGVHSFSKERPLFVAVCVMIVCALLSVPVYALFGSKWIALGMPPFYFELPRPGLYFTWFAFGVLIGTAPFDHGLLTTESALVRRWRWWIGFAFAAFNLQFFLPGALQSVNVMTALGRGSIAATLFIASCAASCFGFLALFRGAVSTRRGWMDSLTRSAYIIYIVHYVFVLWLQRAFMDQPLHASIKFVAVFALSVLFSWLTAQVLLRIPGVNRAL
jgi:glucans biosynthesis protein C